MKYIVYLMAIVATAISLVAPVSVRAQHIISPGIERIPLGGYHSITIYTPSPGNVTTNVTTRIGSGDFSFPTATPHYGGKDRFRSTIYYQQPLVIYQNNDRYPRAIRTNCTTTVLGSPTPSPVALDRYSGRPCG